MGAWLVFEQLRSDLRYAVRALGRDRALTSLAVITLALGIGANTAIFSVINSVMLRPLAAVRAPGELVELISQFPGDPPNLGAFSPRVYEHFRDGNQVFADLIGTTVSQYKVTGDGLDGEGERLQGAYVTGNFFSALGVTPAIGRLIAPQDDRTGGAAAVAVVSWSFWQSRFNLNASIIGKRLMVDDRPITVIGVAPREFSGVVVGLQPALWLPVASHPAPDRLAFGLMARLKPGVSIAQARADMRVLDRFRIEELSKRSTNPAVRQVKIDVASASSGFTVLSDLWATPLIVLMTVVALILLITCINVATMLLARSATRQREMAVRVSLGAGRFRLVRQVFMESLAIASAASLLGVWLAYVGASALVRILLSGRLRPGLPTQLIVDIHPDLRVLAFTAGAAVLSALLFGMAPAWSAFTSSPVSLLRHAGETRSRRLFGKALVVAQVGLSVVLLSAAGLFVGHLSHLRDLDLGFRRESVLLVTVDADRGAAMLVRYRELLDRLRSLPGVQAVTMSGITPLSGAGWSRLVQVEGFQERPEARRYVAVNAIAPRYFDTLRTPLVAGRDFQGDDEGAGRPRVAIINRAMAAYYFGDANPLGRHVTFDDDAQKLPYEIVGVVADAKYDDVHQPAPRTIYIEIFQDGRVPSQCLVRTSVAPDAVSGEVQRVVREVLKPPARVAKVTTLADQVDAFLVPERLLAGLSGLFGALGMLLVSMGLYGLLSFAVTRRIHEIGIRMALGATRGGMMRMVLHNALALVCVGVVAGVPLAIAGKHAAGRWITLSVDGAAPIGIAAATLVAVALLAAYVPARRAGRVEPRDALRHE